MRYIKKTLYFFTLFLTFYHPSLYATERLIPAALKPGDTVALISSGSRVPEDIYILYAAERLRALGLNVKQGDSIFKRYGYFAGTDQERANDINRMFADPDVKAIIQLRGGWGSNRLLNLIDYELIKQHPKIVLGYSDITSLLIAINAKTGLVTFHGPIGVMPWTNFSTQYVKDILFNSQTVTFENPVLEENDLIKTKTRIQTIHSGKATGILIGGNLTVLTSMLGSQYLPNWDNVILFVEDVDEDIYRIDRMLTQLELAGVLKHIKGFIFGQCTDCKAKNALTNYSSLTLDEVLAHHIKPLKIPAWRGAMIGHQDDIFTLPEGIPVEIDADKGTIKMLKPATQKL